MMGFIFMVVALVCFILAGLGVSIHGAAMLAWGMVFLCLGLIFGVSWPFTRPPP